MANEYDNEGGGSGFVMGLLTGTVLGAGLGMLFAPKTGSELRGQISDSASAVGHKASEGYRKAADAAGSVADKSREYYGRAREAVSRGSDEARRYVGQIQERVKDRANDMERMNEPRPSSGSTVPGSTKGPGGI
ncbi:MAG: YtxH domain-containing protein [Bacteroidales bacterium]